MEKLLSGAVVLICTLALLAGFAALLPQPTEAGCVQVFREQVGCCYNQRKYIHYCSDGSHFYSCSGTCGPIP